MRHSACIFTAVSLSFLAGCVSSDVLGKSVVPDMSADQIAPTQGGVYQQYDPETGQELKPSQRSGADPHRSFEPEVRGELYNAETSKMILVPGGGLNGEVIKTIWMDETEVTVEQYQDCVEARVCVRPGDVDEWSSNWAEADKHNHPVNNVSKYNAMTYCGWLGKRLPTDNEWEWAARGRDEGRMYPWGDEAPSESSACWLRYDAPSDTGQGTCPVGQSNETRDGIKDMAGNVWEWTLNPGDERDNVVSQRGGAWYGDSVENMRVTTRGSNSAYNRDAGAHGFRCVGQTEVIPSGSRRTRHKPESH